MGTGEGDENGPFGRGLGVFEYVVSSLPIDSRTEQSFDFTFAFYFGVKCKRIPFTFAVVSN